MAKYLPSPALVWSQVVETGIKSFGFFTGNQFLSMNFGSKVVFRTRGCTRWPSLGHIRHQCGPRLSETGIKLFIFYWESITIYEFWL